MDDKLIRYFKLINFHEDMYELFNEAIITNVKVNAKNKTWTIYMNLNNMIDVNTYMELFNKSKTIDGVKKVYFKFKHNTQEYLKEYFFFIFNNYKEEYPLLNSVSDKDIIIDDNNININVLNINILSLIKELKIENILSNFGYNNIKININISEELIKETQELINKREEVVVSEKPKFYTIIGNPIKGKALPIKNIIAEMDNLCVEVFIFGLDVKETSKGFTIYTLKISDYTDSILAKIFSRDENINKKLNKELSVGSWYKMKGYVKHDNFANDLVFNIRDVESIEKRSNKRTDEAEEKRVELHVHTIMSQMDGLVKPDKLLKKVRDFGHKAVGITDKNCIQAFPKLYNKKGDLKLLFGSELYVVNDNVDIISKETNESLKHSTYIVFDLETTGLNASFDKIIEIGAVKVEDGEITEHYDELINPGVNLREEITNLTNITNDMLKDKRSEDEAVISFKEFIKDYPIVAHNAKFDTSFLKNTYRKYNLGELNNTVLDTLELSRALNPEASRHGLSAIVKRWNVSFDEEGHHRADYDAEGTAKVFIKMIKSLDSSFTEIKDLNKLIDPSNAIKNNRPFHITAFAQTNEGLKNLFKIISDANTTYFHKTPRIPRSRLLELREGLLLGSGCVFGEIFEKARTASEEELINAMEMYDFIEVNPPSICEFMIESAEFTNAFELKETIEKIVAAASKINKMVVATGDVHTLDPDDNIYREILVRQKQPGGGFHPLHRKGIKNVPNAYFMTTDEMLNEFSFLGKDKAFEIVVTNSNKVADSIEDVEVLKKDLYPPRMENSANIVRDMVYTNARNTYGETLPEIIQTRLDKEVNGIINGGYDVMYLIAQRLVFNSNEHGYIVGSRGSVGSSLVATFMNITEVNPLPPHYVCPKCKHSIFEMDGKPLSYTYGSGFDMPDMNCPICGEKMHKDGQDIPFETFLGFNADKTPDIDLNFSGEYQAKAHEYTKVLFGAHNVFKAGTVQTIAEKTAFGFVKGYMEDKGITLRRVEIERLAGGITGIKRTTGQHPGGIIVIPDYKEVFDFTPYQYPAENTEAEWRTTHFEFHDIEPNVLKLDILGHDDPTVLKYLSDDVNIKIEDIPMDDKKVLSLFKGPEALGVTKEQIDCETGTLGVPEFGTNFSIKMLTEINPEHFADLIKISGLSHGTDVWAGNARDLLLSGTCTFDQVIGCRDDIMLYLIKSGIDKGQSFKMSEFIRKGKVAKEPEKWVEFKQILKDHNVPDWYIGSCEKIKYMFPKAHAAAYVTNGCRVAWFKVYHPLNYYRVYLSIRKSDYDIDVMVKGYDAITNRINEITDKGFDATPKEEAVKETLKVAREMVARGFKFENISLEKSDALMFKINETNDGLYPPFIVLDGMGASAATNIVKEREIKPFVSIEDVRVRGKVSQTNIDKLRSMGVFDDLPESSQLSLNLFDL